MQSQNTEYRKGMNYGMGVNLLNGQIAGKGVTPGNITGPTNAGGMGATYKFTLITSYEELYDSLGISISASGHYGLFSAEGKFQFANETKFNSQSTFLLVHAVLENAFTQCEDAVLEEPAVELIKQGKIEMFRERYGDGFIRGMSTGGEYFAIVEIKSSTTEKQQKIGASIKAEYESLVAGVKVEADVNKSIAEFKTQCETNAIHYQRGGQGEEISATISPEQVTTRLKNFATIVQQNPVPYSVQIASYKLLDNYPEGPTKYDIENQKQVLENSARLRLKLLTALNDVQYVQLNPNYFENPPEVTVLNKWSEHISGQLAQLTKEASACARNPVSDNCKFFSLNLPEGFNIPKRNGNMPEPQPQVEMVKIPNVIGHSSAVASAILTRLGLTPILRSLGEMKSDTGGTPVSNLEPAPGVEVSKGSTVTISYYEIVCEGECKPTRALGRRKN
ncbi:PASTA domain-containing protein [Priestia megaterium]|uniref:PASTA domain-containing protein n=1 Tax=Priestia megaterium TaxID=1404 RepID=UPI0031014298